MANVTPDGDSEPNVAAIESLRCEAFSLPVQDRIPLEQGSESLSELLRKVVCTCGSMRTSRRRRLDNASAARTLNEHDR